jgi:alpha-N-arabinofuranosidase
VSLLTERSNIASASVPLDVKLENSWRSVNGTIIMGTDPNGFNYKNNATALIPNPLQLEGNTRPGRGGDWKWNVPGYSITVLQFNV